MNDMLPIHMWIFFWIHPTPLLWKVLCFYFGLGLFQALEWPHVDRKLWQGCKPRCPWLGHPWGVPWTFKTSLNVGRLGWSSKFLFGPDVLDWFGLSNKNAQSARMCWVTLWGTMREIRQCQEVSGSTPWEWGTLHNQGSSLWRTLHIRCVFSFSNE